MNPISVRFLALLALVILIVISVRFALPAWIGESILLGYLVLFVVLAVCYVFMPHPPRK